MQKEVAEKIGIAKSTVFNWEHGTKPELIHLPAIFKFLSYIPFKCPDDTLGKLRYFKLINGLSYERLGKLMNRDPEQLTDWLSNGVKPCKKNLRFIQKFLDKNLN